MQKRYIHQFFGIAFALFLCLTAFSFYLYRNYCENLNEKLITQIQASASLAEQDFRRSVFNNISSLENLKNRIQESNGLYFPYWKNDAKRIISQNNALKFIEWIDNDGIIQEIVPVNGNEPAIKLDIKKLDYRYAEWLGHSADTITNITPWLELTQGGNSFLIDVPVYFKGKFQGTITAGMDFKAQFDKLGSNLNEYAILINDEEGHAFYSFNNPQPDIFSPELVYNAAMTVDANPEDFWSFKFMYRDKKVLQDHKLIATYVFIFGLVSSLITSFLVFFYLKAKKAAAGFEKANAALKNLNRALAREKENATKALLAKTEFLSNMSHEIRTPLNAILGLSEILKSKANEEQQPLINMMTNSSATLLGLVDNILLIDKIESGKEVLHTEQFVPLEIIKNNITYYSPQIERYGLQLKLNFDACKACKVVGDKLKFEQIFVNLLKNAIKFTQKGHIEIIYSEGVVGTNVQLALQINDTGIGIPEDKIDTIFERFYQVDGGIAKKHGGGGLGLPITKHLVHLFDGTINVSSKVSKGTSFTVELELPVDYAGIELTENKEIPDLSALSVLIVDDNKLNTFILEKCLKQLKIGSDVAYNGIEALEKTREQYYDLVFMDVHMPELDGFETTRRIRQFYKNTLIIGLSADATNSAMTEGLRSGMDYYLTKPLDRNKLIDILMERFPKEEYADKNMQHH